MILKAGIIVLVSIALGINVCAQTSQHSINNVDSTKKIEMAELSCGECQFKMKGKSCDLAVRIKGKTYFVDGTTIDKHGDAHAKNGFCETIRKAEVQGEVVGDRYKVSYLKLLP